MPSYHLFTQKGTNYSLVTWLNGEGRLYSYSMRQVMFVQHWADDSHRHCSADLHCVLSCEKQKGPASYGILVTLADFVAPKDSSGGSLIYLPGHVIS